MSAEARHLTRERGVGKEAKNHREFIWSVADLLRGDYKPSEYGKVILPLTVLRRLDCVLAPTKERVAPRRRLHALGPQAPLDRFDVHAAGGKDLNQVRIRFVCCTLQNVILLLCRLGSWLRLEPLRDDHRATLPTNS